MPLNHHAQYHNYRTSTYKHRIIIINTIDYTWSGLQKTIYTDTNYSLMGVGQDCGQNCLFDYELFTEMDAVELSDSMRKYLW